MSRDRLPLWGIPLWGIGCWCSRHTSVGWVVQHSYDIQGYILVDVGGRRWTPEANLPAGMDAGGRQRTAAAVFKTVAGRPSPSWVGSTPIRLCHRSKAVDTLCDAAHSA